MFSPWRELLSENQQRALQQIQAALLEHPVALLHECNVEREDGIVHPPDR